MNKIFKYSIIVVQSEQDETTQEFSFEDAAILHVADDITVKFNQEEYPIHITNVRRVDHITTPNDAFDYRLFGFLR